MLSDVFNFQNNMFGVALGMTYAATIAIWNVENCG